jgi:hypothetical protein
MRKIAVKDLIIVFIGALKQLEQNEGVLKAISGTQA